MVMLVEEVEWSWVENHKMFRRQVLTFVGYLCDLTFFRLFQRNRQLFFLACITFYRPVCSWMKIRNLMFHLSLLLESRPTALSQWDICLCLDKRHITCCKC